MHRRRKEYRLAEHLGFASEDKSPKLSTQCWNWFAICAPTSSSHSKFQSHVFCNKIFGIIVTGVTGPRITNSLKLLAIIQQVIVGARMFLGKTNEQVSINVDGLLCVFILMGGRRSGLTRIAMKSCGMLHMTCLAQCC